MSSIVNNRMKSGSYLMK